jgi:hypothetical protein
LACLLEKYQAIVEVGVCTWPTFTAPAQIAQMLLLAAGVVINGAVLQKIIL